jgi:hypothetical protein
MPIVRMTSAALSLVVLCACAGSNAVVKNSSCPTETGSRLAGSAAECPPGHSYSSDDIQRTGATTVGGSLRLLDPSLTVH